MPEPLTVHWRIWRGDYQSISSKSRIITCPVRPNSNKHLNKIFTLVLHLALDIGWTSNECRHIANALTLAASKNDMRMNTFKDNFSKQAEVYVKFRPTYPKELFEFLKGLTVEHKLAWDCGTGNGQSAVQLAKFYEKIYATDPSQEQIKNAIPDDKILYKVENAETPSSINDSSVDLITVAQAVHWFDFITFYEQVKRVLKPNGVIAVWAYGVPSINKELDVIIRDFHDNVVGEFWLPENKLIDKEYSTIPFPFKEVKAPEFFIKKQVTLSETLGHLRSWSATQKYIDKYNENPIDTLSQRLQQHWKNIEKQKEMTWKLILKIGKIVSC